MSDKKSKSKSKSKQKQVAADKPPKSKKSKEQKGDKADAKSKKSVEKDKGSKKEKASKKDPGQKSKISKADIPIPENQSQMSYFKPMLYTHPPIIEPNICQYHKQKNTIFCQICEQAGCQSCLIYGPHNNQMHRVSKTQQSFKVRYMYLNEIVCGQLIQRRDRLNRQLEQLTLLADQLRYYKNGIEKSTKVQFNQMLQRLKTSAGSKFAILHHEMAELQKDLQGINALGNQFFQLTNMNPQSNLVPETNPHKGMVPFLLRSKYLQEQAQQLISKPLKTSVDVYPYDLPRQLTQRKMILQKNKSWTDLLTVKDEVIWNLLQQKKSINQKLWDSFYQQANVQYEQWSKLKQKLQEEIVTFNMSCSNCNIVFSQDSVNQNCTQNGQAHNFLFR